MSPLSRTLIIGSITGVLVAVAAYFSLQRIVITTHLEIFVEAEPIQLFEYARDPHNLVESSHEIKKVEVQTDNTEGKDREIRFILTHQIPHIGNHMVWGQYVIDNEKMKIHSETVLFNGFLQGEFSYSFNKAKHRNRRGTLLVEKGAITMPWLLRNFANKTTVNQHTNMLQNIKMIVEFRTNEYIADFKKKD